MTAITNIVEICCDGPDGQTPCPRNADASSARQSASELRDSLAERGWEYIRGDVPMDRCPTCGNGTA